MNQSAAIQSSAPPAITASTSKRLLSLDVFRGLVIVVMTLVNYLSPVRGVPPWAKHMPEKFEGYTFVDVVFPAFLFMVGMAIPFAFQRRLERGDSPVALAGKIAVRSAALIFLGVVTVNPMFYSEELSVLSKPLWFFLTILSVVLLGLICPEDASPARRRAQRIIQICGGVMLVILLCLFRGKNMAGQAIWLRHSWWGMLGLIGWAYLETSLCWLVFRRSTTALMGILWFMIAIYMGDREGMFAFFGDPNSRPLNIGPLFGTDPATIMMGVLVGHCLKARDMSPVERLLKIILFGLGLYLAGSLLRPLHGGINKSAHSESYALVTGGICCLVFAAVYYLVDMKQWRSWGTLLVPLGQNALLAYLLPDLLHDALASCSLSPYWATSGTAGEINATILTIFILVAVWMLTRARVILRF